MREILFRGKRVDNGGWVEGYYAVKGKDTDLEKHFIVTSTFDSNTNAYPFYFTDNWVEPETVCQHTGLTDKNGRKIFEGDIVSAHFAGYSGRAKTKNGIIEFVKGAFSVNWNDSEEYGKNFAGYVNDIEVIGNIFDNPELIEDDIMEEFDLKPCPFCGGEAVYMDKNTDPDRPHPTIICDDCAAEMVEVHSKEFVIEQWNRRVMS